MSWCKGLFLKYHGQCKSVDSIPVVQATTCLNTNPLLSILAWLWGASGLDTSLKNVRPLKAALGGSLATQEAVLAESLGGSGKYEAHSIGNPEGSLPVILPQWEGMVRS